MLTSQESKNIEDVPILHEEVQEAITSLKNGQAAGVHNTPAEFIKQGGQAIPESAARSGRRENDQQPGQSLSLSLYPRKATYSCARTTEQLV